jgi:hypothetical protein
MLWCCNYLQRKRGRETERERRRGRERGREAGKRGGRERERKGKRDGKCNNCYHIDSPLFFALTMQQHNITIAINNRARTTTPPTAPPTMIGNVVGSGVGELSIIENHVTIT